jgi:hypothetical protein
MVFADSIQVELTTDKDFTTFDEAIFNRTYFQRKVLIQKLVKFENRVTNLNFTPFYYFSNWKLEAPHKLIYVNSIDEKQYFFLETLQYLMNTYFTSMKIQINGVIYGKECIFGDDFRFEIHNSKISKNEKYFQNLTI